MEEQISDNAIMFRVDPFIFHMTDLTLLEKILLNFVFGWAVQHKCCWTSNAWLGHKFGFSAADIKSTLELLQVKGLITINYDYPEGNRTLNFVFDETIPNPCDGLTGPEQAFILQ
jgi:hypothetical protein